MESRENMLKRNKRKHRHRSEELSFNEKIQREERENKLATKIVKRLVLTLLAVVVIFTLLVGTLVFTGGIGTKENVEVDIPQGASTSQIGQILQEKGIIFSGELFKFYLRFNNHNDIRAGRYTMTTSSSFSSAVNQLENNYEGVSADLIVIPEGSNLTQIAQILAKALNLNADDVTATLTSDSLFKDMLAKYPDLLTTVSKIDDVRYKLEGYLYPSSYSYSQGDTVETVVDKMLAEMNKIRQTHASEISQSQLNFHQILTMASLVEKEAAKETDRKLVAGVFFNRLKQNMPLQSDISINYSNDQHSSYVTIKDTQVNSPYNLYRNTGLGPGPFDSPSLNSIEAVLNPTPSSYLYFVADLKSGQVYYSDTYDEHMKKVNQYVSEEDASLASSSSSSSE